MFPRFALSTQGYVFFIKRLDKKKYVLFLCIELKNDLRSPNSLTEKCI